MSETAGAAVKYNRVMLKISGEALMGDQGYGLHPPTVARIAEEVKSVRDLGVVAYLGVPLITGDDTVLGTLCVIDHVPRSWSREQLHLLTDLPAAATAHLEGRIRAN